MTAKPDEGDCAVALAFRIDRGSKGSVALDGLAFIVVARTKGAMIDGGWTVGLVVDERASQEQADAIPAIASGQAGGPMAAVAPLIGSFAGVERRPVGRGRRPALLGDRGRAGRPGLRGLPPPIADGEPLMLDNTLHPANRAWRSRRRPGAASTRSGSAGTTGAARNGHFAPFRGRPKRAGRARAKPSQVATADSAARPVGLTPRLPGPVPRTR